MLHYCCYVNLLIVFESFNVIQPSSSESQANFGSLINSLPKSLSFSNTTLKIRINTNVQHSCCTLYEATFIINDRLVKTLT